MLKGRRARPRSKRPLPSRRRSNLHDREIRSNDGCIIKLGRGLDIYWLSAWAGIVAAYAYKTAARPAVDEAPCAARHGERSEGA